MDRPAAEDFEPAFKGLSAGHCTLTFGRLATFAIDFNAREVRIPSVAAGLDAATLDHLLNDHVAPRIIAGAGLLVLHGSAVEIDGRLALLLGTTGSGKSTLSASLHRSGARLLGDDAAVITENGGILYGEAVYPSLRLFPESIEHVLEPGVSGRPMAYYSEKLLVASFGAQAGLPARLPIGAIYILTDGDEGSQEITIEPFLPAMACLNILEHGFALDPDDAKAAAQRMTQAARLAASVPCYELCYPYNFALLQEVGNRVRASMHASLPDGGLGTPTGKRAP